MRTFGTYISTALIAASLGLIAGPAASQATSPNQSSRGAEQIEYAAMRIVHSDFARRGVTAWNDVGFDPDVDVHMRPVVPPRDSRHAQTLVSTLGARRVSSDSVRPNTPGCDAASPAILVYLNPPLILGDSAAIQVTYAFRSQQSICYFFIEAKTFAFIRRGGDWLYVGVQGATVRR